MAIETRIEYMISLAKTLTEAQCQAFFDRDRESMLDGTAAWSKAFEVAYNDYRWYEDEEYDEEGEDRMLCDCCGVCNGEQCKYYDLCNR